MSELNVQHVPFFEMLNNQLQKRSLADWKAYLRWHLIHANAPFLSKAFVDESFDFFSKTLRGVEQQQPRWKRCVPLVDNHLGEALGQEFVAKVFSPELKATDRDHDAADRAGDGRGHQGADLDECRDEARSAEEAPHHRQQDRISGPVARLQLREDCAQ